MPKYKLTWEKEVEAEDEDEAINNLFESLEENNETPETYFFETIQINLINK